jgi:hypothetical protein
MIDQNKNKMLLRLTRHNHHHQCQFRQLIDDDGYDGLDEEAFCFYFDQSFFEALEEEEIDDTYTLETVHWKRNSGDDDGEYYIPICILGIRYSI